MSGKWTTKEIISSTLSNNWKIKFSFSVSMN